MAVIPHRNNLDQLLYCVDLWTHLELEGDRGKKKNPLLYVCLLHPRTSMKLNKIVMCISRLSPTDQFVFLVVVHF